MYKQTTRGVTITVDPMYLDDQSDPEENRFVWAYRVRIENQSPDRIQLLTRHWRITDALGKTEVVDGAGVVGEQPVLEPGQRFEYTSGAPLATPSGIMVGRYEMKCENGEMFDALIPAFSLDSPFGRGPLN
ncbi:MAG: Co2+/Mg2+ efflux protein ApaG [Alphaproteobacteria bacterium RIFOXYD12_FULL_60_8]|nr:MAG: Co2+/Mg2+ efflux protein ApaG [Alphaproteobacteria bacterium RIFOXYD12_FULL_60_8]